jgi:hypothetical protein
MFDLFFYFLFFSFCIFCVKRQKKIEIKLKIKEQKRLFYEKHKYCEPSEIRLIQMLNQIGFEDKQIFYNLYIPVGQNYQQIDVCVVCKIGIIVFEVKDFAGWIFGGVDEKYWHHTYQNQEKYKMYNPIRQNNVHVSCMKKYFKDLPLINVVVFFGDCELIHTRFLSSKCCVIYDHQLTDCINYLYFHNKKILKIKKEYTELLDKFMENGNNTDIQKQHNDNILKIKTINV